MPFPCKFLSSLASWLTKRMSSRAAYVFDPPRYLRLALPVAARTGGLVLTTLALVGGPVYCANEGKDGGEQQSLKHIDPEKLTTSYLIRNAAKINVDSATTLLTQTATALLETNANYIELLSQLARLEELMVTSRGVPQQEERVADAILIVRKKLTDVKAARQELEVLFSSVERLMNNAAEVAFFSGADDACTMANERLFSAQEKVNAAAEKSQGAEISLREQEAWVVAETVKRDEKLKGEQAVSQPPTESLDEPDKSVSHDRSDASYGTSIGDLGTKEFNKDEFSSSPPSFADSKDTWFSTILDDSEDQSAEHEHFKEKPEDTQEDQWKWES